jgi:hypothetical protein
MKRVVLPIVLICFAACILLPACQKSEEIGETAPAEVLVAPTGDVETMDETKEKQEYREEMVERSQTIGDLANSD